MTTLADRNVWLFGEAVQQYPCLIEVCGNLLPDAVAREYSGTAGGNDAGGSTGTAEGDRKRRAEVKRDAAETSYKVGTSGKKVKAESPGSAMADQFKGVVATVAAPGSSAGTADSACVNLKVLDEHV